jgi:hypothetical protein
MKNDADETVCLEMPSKYMRGVINRLRSTAEKALLKQLLDDKHPSSFPCGCDQAIS